MKNLIGFVVFFLFGCFCYSQDDLGLIEASVVVEQDENSIRFKPVVLNHSPLYFEYNYLLLIRKTDKNDRLSVEHKRGRFTLIPEEVKSLPPLEYAKTSDIEKIKINFFIRDEEENLLIAKDSAEVKNVLLNRGKRLDERSVAIRGIVVDETKTKVGSDFYSEFFSIYNRMPTKLDFIISISELPYRGMTSVIQVKADQDLIYEFYTNPNEAYIQQQAQQTIRAIGRYIRNKENLKYEFNY